MASTTARRLHCRRSADSAVLCAQSTARPAGNSSFSPFAHRPPDGVRVQCPLSCCGLYSVRAASFSRVASSCASVVSVLMTFGGTPLCAAACGLTTHRRDEVIGLRQGAQDQRYCAGTSSSCDAIVAYADVLESSDGCPSSLCCLIYTDGSEALSLPASCCRPPPPPGEGEDGRRRRCLTLPVTTSEVHQEGEEEGEVELSEELHVRGHSQLYALDRIREGSLDRKLPKLYKKAAL